MFSMRVSEALTFLVLSLAGFTACQKPVLQRRANVEFADQSFLEIITQRKAPIVVGRIEKVKNEEVADEVARGELVLDRIQEITQGIWAGRGDLVLRYERYASNLARIKSGAQGWNGVSIDQGKYLVLALGNGQPLEAIAVRAIASPGDAFVKQLQSCLTAENQTDPTARLALIKEAILGGEEFLSGYGHYAAGRLKRIPRHDAVSLETSVLLNANIDERIRLAAGQTLELELWEADRDDDAPNAQILSTFCNALHGAPQDLQNYMAEALFRLIIGDTQSSDAKAMDHQRKLRHGVVVQSEMQTLKALEDWGRRENSRDEAVRLERWVRQ